MEYPNVIYGDYGDEKVAQSTKIGDLPLGQLMVLPDGRKFRHAKAGGTALSAGIIVGASAGSAGHGNLAGTFLKASATTTRNLKGDRVVYLATSRAAFTKDQFADGYLNVQGPAASSYIGHVYKIEANDSAASIQAGGDLKIKLYQTDPLKVAFAADVTQVSLKKSPYSEVVVHNGCSIVGPPIGVVGVAVSANFYHWVQKHGECSIHQAATQAVVGEGIVPDMKANGSITVAFSAATGTQGKLGYALEGTDDHFAVMCFLDMD